MIPGMYATLGLQEQMLNERDQDVSLEVGAGGHPRRYGVKEVKGNFLWGVKCGRGMKIKNSTPKT